MPKTYKGKVKFWKPEENYGFIIVDGEEYNAHVHISKVLDGNDLEKDQRVEFHLTFPDADDPKQKGKSPSAYDVRVTD